MSFPVLQIHLYSHKPLKDEDDFPNCAVPVTPVVFYWLKCKEYGVRDADFGSFTQIQRLFMSLVPELKL